MSVLKKFIQNPSKGKAKDTPQEVPEINDSTRNPYTETLILLSHQDIIQSIIKIDDNRFLSLSEDGVAIVWDIKTGREITTIKHKDGSRFVCSIVTFCEILNSYLYVAATADKHIHIYSVDTGECLHSITEPNTIVRCLMSIQSKNLLCSAGNNVCLWQLDGTLLTVLHTSHPDGFFVSGSIDGTIILWRAYDMLPTRYFNSVKHYAGFEHNYPYSIQHVISLDERYVCAAIGTGFAVFDSLTGKTVIEMSNCHHSKVVYITPVWGNLFLATCSQDCTIRLWGLSSVLDSSTYAPTCIYTLFGLGENDVPPWQKDKKPSTLELLGECAGHSATVSMVLDFGENGIVSSGADSLVIFWKNAEIENMLKQESIHKLLFMDT